MSCQSAPPRPSPAGKRRASVPSFTTSTPNRATGRRDPHALFRFRLVPFPHVARAEHALRSGISPFAVASAWEADHDRTRLSQTALSSWRQYSAFCASWEQDPLPLSVTSLVAYFLHYVLVRGHSSANLNSVASNLRAVADANRHPWPEFEAAGGDSVTRRILKIQKDWPAEVLGAPH